MHHNQLKYCPTPLDQGQPYHPVPETPGILRMGGSEAAQQEEGPEVVDRGIARPRPPRLWQVINPPERYGPLWPSLVAIVVMINGWNEILFVSLFYFQLFWPLTPFFYTWLLRQRQKCLWSSFQLLTVLLIIFSKIILKFCFSSFLFSFTNLRSIQTLT